MEAPQLDLTSELLEVYGADGGSSDSGGDDQGVHSPVHPNGNAANASYISSPRKVKAGPGQHKKTVTKRTRLPLNWNRVRTFTEETEAQTFIQSFEGYNWRKGCNNKTSGGLKCYYICKESSLCKVMSLLHYDSKTNLIVLYQSDRPHHHGPGPSPPRNGFPAPTRKGALAVEGGLALPLPGSSSTISASLPPGDAKFFQTHADGPSASTQYPSAQSLQLATVPAKKPGGGRRRGLSDETAGLISRLFTADPHIKPSQIHEELKRAGTPLIQNYHINNFLAKLRKQLKQAGQAAAAAAAASGQQIGTRSSGRARQLPARFSDEYEDRMDGRNGLMLNGHGGGGQEYDDYDDDYDDDHDANNSSTTDTWFNKTNPMSMVDIDLTNPFDDGDSEGEGEDADGVEDGDGLMDDNDLFNHPPSHSIADENGDMLLGVGGLGDASMSVTITGAGNQHQRNSTSPTGRRFSTEATAGHSGGAMPTSTTGPRNNQSEVVSTSTTLLGAGRSRKRNFYFRDESTKEGDNISPHEDNIKGLIVRHIQDNYSNRDMLHIREELRTLKDMKKFRALNRLLSFTAGFLQDSFIDVTSPTATTAAAASATNGNGNGHGSVSPKL